MAKTSSFKRSRLSKRSKMAKKSKRSYKKRSSQPAVTRIRVKAIPDKMIVKLPYTDVATYVTSNYYNSKSYNINNVWDPETNTLNNSAYGLAQFAGLYEKFRVTAVTYKVEAYNASTNPSPIAAYVNFAPQGEGFLPQNFPSWDQRFTTQRMLMPNPIGRATWKGTLSIPKIFGLTPEQYRTNDLYVGVTNGQNPASMAQMSVGWRSMDGASSTNMSVKVQLTYHVELFDRVDNLISSTRNDAGDIQTQGVNDQ